MLNIIDSAITNKERDYVSFSELYLFDSCPYKHHQNYNLKKDRESNFYSIFGSAIHEAIEQKWKHKNEMAWLHMAKIVCLTARLFLEENGKFAGKTPQQWVRSAFRIYNDFFPWMKKEFPDYELYDIEMELREDLENFDRQFLGYIDLIVYNAKTDHYMIIDLKTSGWGWNRQQLSDTKKLYQVVLYKHFFCKAKSIDPKKVDCCYVLLLRNPPKSMELAIKLVSQSSKERRVKNSLEWMDDTLKKIKRGIMLKSPQTCSFCICGAVPNKFAKKSK